MTNNILSSIFAVVFVMTAICLMVFLFLHWLWKYGKRKLAEDKENEADYEYLYNDCVYDIEHLTTDSWNYDYIMERLQEFGQLKHKDKERTCVLTCNFLRKFKTEVDKRLTA